MLPIYDNVNTIRLAAEVRLNGIINTLQPITGQLLKNTQPFSQQIFNNAFRKLQEYLAAQKYTGIEQELTFLAVPAITTTDPIVQVFINYGGYFNGTGNVLTPILPTNFLRAYELWERPSSPAGGLLTEMDEVFNGLPKVPKMSWNRQWEWRDDQLYMPGATVPTDIVLRYAQLFGDVIDIPVGTTPGPNQIVGPWFVQPVPIMRCLDALADYMCREVFYSRGDMDAVAAVQTMAEAEARLIVDRQTTQGDAVLKVSELQKMTDRYTPMKGGAKPQTEK